MCQLVNCMHRDRYCESSVVCNRGLVIATVEEIPENTVHNSYLLEVLVKENRLNMS